ncbi:lysophospholipid acyltransferase family protein [Aureispira anguillae]|uniref:Lysophospholipid acyltransferase family protein n=1 Tax=Aureispira anguillae TaxID=2864201 RepID=A0A915YDX3_9BACT|nr:lysophospholipid acyltransferase family protein [Aureispira anguillae]BDS11272.1 lysophospholipid acyltransferase family protein [Aureispira anguillae]
MGDSIFSNKRILAISFLVYIAFRLLVLLFRIMPFWLLYRLSDFTYLLLYKIIGYRKKVVRKNLKNAFPQKTAKELKTIEKKFYQHLFDILLEGIKGFSLSKETLLKRQKYLTPDLPQSIIDKGKSALIVGGHYGNWEWGGMSASFHVSTDVVVLFSPIKNPYIDRYIKASRGSYDTFFWASPQAPRAFKAYKDKKATFVLIADQSPSNPKRAHWLPFLNQDTAVLRGPASYAHNYNIPLLFIDIQRVKRGYYTMAVSVITEHPQDHSPQELSAMYMQKLEGLILKRPELWLWSHRRWKHSRSNESTVN